jgi:hypothetical protein
MVGLTLLGAVHNLNKEHTRSLAVRTSHSRLRADGE